MTLQEIADYAMDYLDSKGVAAEYDIFKCKSCVKISANNDYVILTSSYSRIEVNSRLKRYILNT